MANETGHTDLANNWQTEYDDYKQAFFKVLAQRADENKGYIPPALDGQNVDTTGATCWPLFRADLDAHDPRVTATLKATQAKYAEAS